MSNIITAISLLNNARAARENGEYLKASNLAVSAQRIASQCRASAREDVAWSAHNVIASCASKAAEQVDKSQIGRDMAESRYIGWVF